jgi:tetratricopeptide (TPR) repeat protein
MNLIVLKSAHTSSRIVDKTYEFTHEIEREVIYDSILNKEKAILHKRISEYLEALYVNDVENHYEILCIHLVKAGLPKKAAGYYYEAAMKQKEGFNLYSALECFERFIDLVKADGGNTSDERILNAYREKGRIHFINANYDEALEQFYTALKYAEMQDDINNIKILIAEVYKDMGRLEDALLIINELESELRQGNSNYGRWLQLKCNILRIKGDTGALMLAKKSEKTILKTGDFRSLSEIMKHAGMIYFSKGDIDNALDYMNKSYRYAEKNKLLEIMAKVSGDLGIIYHSTGMISKAQEFFNKSIDISKKLSYQRGFIAGSINLGILFLDKGQFVSAKKLFHQSHEIAREVGSKLYECVSLTNLGDIAYETGEFEAVQKYYEDSLSLARELEATVEEGVNYIGLARVEMKFNRHQDASELLERAFMIFNEADELAGLGDYYTYKGYIEQQDGRFKAAEEHYDKAADIFGECRNDKKKLKAIRYKGSLLVQTGQHKEAIELFEQSILEADSVESDYESAKCWFGKYKALIAAGRQDEANTSIQKAVSYIKKADDCRWSSIILSENSRIK